MLRAFYNSCFVFFTHNWKYVSSMQTMHVWLCFIFFFFFPSLVSHIFESEWWNLETKICRIWVIKTELRWHDGKFCRTMDPTVSVLYHVRITSPTALFQTLSDRYTSHFIISFSFLYPSIVSSSLKLSILTAPYHFGLALQRLEKERIASWSTA